MALGLGFAPDENTSPVASPSIAAPARPTIDPFGTGPAQREAPIIDGKKNPLQAIGAVLLNVQRGINGDKLYTDDLRDKRNQEDLLNLKKLDVGITALAKGMELLKKTPAAQRQLIAKQYGKLYEHILPGFTDTLEQATLQPDMTAEQLSVLGEHGKELIVLGGDLEGALKLAREPKIIKQLDATADARNAPDISQAFQRAKDLLSKDPGANQLLEKVAQDGFTLAELQDPQVQQGLGLTQGMVNSIARNKEIQSSLRPFGFIPLSDADAAAKARAGDKPLSQISAEAAAQQSAKENAKMIAFIGTDGTIRRAPQGQAAELAAQGFQPVVTGRTQQDVEENARRRVTGKQEGEDLTPLDPYIVRNTGLPATTTVGEFRAQGGSGQIDPSIVRELQSVQTAVKNTSDTISRMKQLVASNPDVNALGPQLTEFSQNLRADITSVGKALGVKWLDQLDKQIADHLPQVRDAGIKSAEMQSLVFDLAYISAVARGQHGQGLSNKDVERFAKIIGVAQADPKQLRAVLDSVEARLDTAFRNKFETAVGVRPRSVLPDIQEAEALGERVARGERVDPSIIKTLTARQVESMRNAINNVKRAMK